MSAFMCSARHISAIVNAAKQPKVRTRHKLFGSPDPLNISDEEATFMALKAENAASIVSRYPQEVAEPWMLADLDAMRYQPQTKAPNTLAAVKLIDSYRYQSCEHEGWKDSAVDEWTHGLRGALISTLPQYAAAEWSV